MIAFFLLCLFADTRSCFYFDFNLHWHFLVIDILHIIFLLWYFLCTQFYSNRTPLKPYPQSGGKISSNHNSEQFEATKTRYSLHRSQNSVFHGRGRKKDSLCCESPNKEIKSLSECRCHEIGKGGQLIPVGWLHIK